MPAEAVLSLGCLHLRWHTDHVSVRIPGCCRYEVVDVACAGGADGFPMQVPHPTPCTT
jgi:hypothetical protein